MPVFGKTVFQTLLDKAEDQSEEEEDEAMAPSSLQVRGFNSGFVHAGWNPVLEADPAELQYGYDGYLDAEDLGPEPPREPETLMDLSRMLKLTPEDIAAELDLAGVTDIAALRRLRRDFARANHPDRVPAVWRQEATIRMMIANQLIDKALRALSRA
jgi:hypothetical protein